MSNLSKRVEKAKKLIWSHNPYLPGQYGTRGSEGKDYGEKYYQVSLSHKKETVNTPDGKRNIVTLLVSCKKDTGNGTPCNCPGNERYTVCYHGLGALYESFKNSDKLISFFETYESATRMSFGGKIVKVQSVEGKGFVWATIKDWPKKDIIVEIKQVEDEEEVISSLKNKEKIVKRIFRASGKPVLPAQENINLMRGQDDDEGID